MNEWKERFDDNFKISTQYYGSFYLRRMESGFKLLDIDEIKSFIQAELDKKAEEAQELIKQAKLEAVIEYVESCKSMQCNPDRKREAIKSEIEKE